MSPPSKKVSDSDRLPRQGSDSPHRHSTQNEKSRRLQTERLPEDLSHPHLKIAQSNRSFLLFTSFGGALGIVAGIFGCLAFILITKDLLQLEELTSMDSIVISNAESIAFQTDSEQDPPLQAPPRIVTNPIPPLGMIRPSTLHRDDSPAFVEIPSSEVEPLDFLELEELVLDDPTATESKIKAPVQKPVETSQKEKAQRLAAQKRREAERQAAQAKRIAKGASVVSQASPIYPRDARRQKIQGRVIVAVTIGTNGRVVASAVNQSSGNSSLDSAALQAARKFRFKAAINGLGQAAISSKRIPFDFKLK